MNSIRLTINERKRIKKMMLGQKIAFRLNQRATLVVGADIAKHVHVARAVVIAASSLGRTASFTMTRKD